MPSISNNQAIQRLLAQDARELGISAQDARKLQQALLPTPRRAPLHPSAPVSLSTLSAPPPAAKSHHGLPPQFAPFTIHFGECGPQRTSAISQSTPATKKSSVDSNDTASDKLITEILQHDTNNGIDPFTLQQRFDRQNTTRLKELQKISASDEIFARSLARREAPTGTNPIAAQQQALEQLAPARTDEPARQETTSSTHLFRIMEQLPTAAKTRLSMNIRKSIPGVYADCHNLNTPNATYIEGSIVGDGDCGFSATNTTRQDIVHQLIANADDYQIRQLIAPEILDMNPRDVIALSLPVEDLQFLLNLQTMYRAQPERIDRISQELAKNETIFKTYITSYYRDRHEYLVTPKTNTTGVLNFIALATKTPIRVWQINAPANPPTANLIFKANPSPSDTPNSGLDIICRPDFGHYNKLIPINTQTLIQSNTLPLGTTRVIAPLAMYYE